MLWRVQRQLEGRSPVSRIDNNARDPGKGFAVEVEGAWLWYDTWIKRCIEMCEAEGDKYM